MGLFYENSTSCRENKLEPTNFCPSGVHALKRNSSRRAIQLATENCTREVPSWNPCTAVLLLPEDEICLRFNHFNRSSLFLRECLQFRGQTPHLSMKGSSHGRTRQSIIKVKMKNLDKFLLISSTRWLIWINSFITLHLFQRILSCTGRKYYPRRKFFLKR